jgi:phage shock protein C
MKRLYRTRKESPDHMIGGICSGISETYGVDPRVVRLVCIFLAIASMFIPLLVTYGIAWMMLPEQPDT